MAVSGGRATHLRHTAMLATLLPRDPRRLALGGLVAVAAGIAVFLAMRAHGAGDGWEYQCMLESWFRHLSPEQRLADAEQARRVAGGHIWLGDIRDGFFPTGHGRWFSYHFWFYSLLALPAKAILHVLHADEFYALAWTNAALFASAIALALRRASDERVAFVVLAATGPIAWYISWPHAEVFEWALVLTSLCAYEQRRYPLASLCAALASLQAPPIALLTLPPIGAAILSKKRRDVALAVIAALVTLAPPLFYKVMYGQANLILTTGMASAHMASARRVLTLLFDLDHGMLAYVPVTLGLGVAGLVVGKRRVEAAVFLVTALVMATLATETCNFNAGCVGMNRYATWIAPVFAFVAARNIPLRGRAARLGMTAGVALQVALALMLNGDDDAHAHHPMAEAVLKHVPRLFPQEPETFAERTTGRPVDWPFMPIMLPIAIDGAHGPAKILVDRPTLDRLDRWFDVQSAWLATERQAHTHEEGLFYVEPDGMVQRRADQRKRDGLLTFGDGWYGPEGDQAPRFRWMQKHGELVVRRSAAKDMLRLTGLVPPELTSQPTLRITIRGVVVDELTAPRGLFTRDVVLPPGDDEDLTMTIDSSSAHELEGRTLAYALMRYGPVITPANIGGPGLHFTGDWDEALGAPPHEARCMHTDASMHIDPTTTDATLVALAVSPLTDGPSTWRVTIDGREVEHDPLFRQARRIWPLHGRGAHDVTFAAKPSLCFWSLRVVPSAVLN
jgi:hypothetical protein